jgi:hypothetical protein
MQSFFIEINMGSVRPVQMQVDELPLEKRHYPDSPEFIVEFHNDESFIMLTLISRQGEWHELEAHISEEYNRGNNAFRYRMDSITLQEVGKAISNHLISTFKEYSSLFPLAHKLSPN